MRPRTSTGGRLSVGFTLIELLVVIAVIALLAAMIFPIGTALGKVKIKTRTNAELQQLQTAIEAYKAKLGHYPPDNGTNHLVNQLYYELVGGNFTKAANSTSPNTNSFTLLDGTTLSVSTFVTALSHANSLGRVNATPVGGLVNFVPVVDNEEGSAAVNFIKTGFNSAQFQDDPVTGLRFLVSTIKWQNTTFAPYSGFVGNCCAWRYNSANPVNNPNSFDLWVDVLIGGKTNRFCNWSRDPIIVGTPDE